MKSPFNGNNKVCPCQTNIENSENQILNHCITDIKKNNKNTKYFQPLTSQSNIIRANN